MNRERTMNSQEANSSSTREKADFAQPITRDKETKWNHRKSLAWDTAFFTNPGVLDHEELFGNLTINENEIKTLPCFSSNTDARPSFAWDNAFFTNPGVLDAEELSLVNNGVTSDTPLRKSTDSMSTTTQGSRIYMSSIEADLFHDMRVSLRTSSPNVKLPITRETHHNKLPNGKKRTNVCRPKKDQPLSLIPRPKMSFASSISKLLTPKKSKAEKKCVASELEETKGKKKTHYGFEEQSRAKSIIRSSYSGYTMKDLTSSSSGLRLPLPKMGFFDSENGEKENMEPNVAEASGANRRRVHKSKHETSSPIENRNILGQRKTRK